LLFFIFPFSSSPENNGLSINPTTWLKTSWSAHVANQAQGKLFGPMHRFFQARLTIRHRQDI
jgi:hypothetical protein